MAGQCVVCHDKEADHRCVQCHKPVCDDCAFKDDQGVFCGRDCAAAYRSYAAADARAKTGRGPMKLILALLIVAVLLVLAYVKGWLPFGKEPAPEAGGGVVAPESPEASDMPDVPELPATE